MANVIKIKNSGTANSAPTSLEAGELAINYADGKIYYKNSSNAIVQFANSGGITVSDSAPSSPSAGNLWYESDTGKTFVYYDSFWVEIGAGSASASITLGADTAGDYVASLIAGTGITLTNNTGEAATPTIAVNTSSIQTRVDNVTDTEIGYLDGVTSAIQTQINAKANSNSSPTITLSGDLSGSATLANLGNTTLSATIVANSVTLGTDTVGDYTSSLVAGTGIILANNSGEGATPTVAVNTSVIATIASPTFTGVPLAPTAANTVNNTQIATTAYVKTVIGDLINSAPATLDTLGEIANSLANNNTLSSTLTTSIALKAPLADPTFTGTVTIPAGASISGFAPLANPAFTGNVSGITKTMVGLGSVDNTTDLGKPISNATQTALDLKANLANSTFTGTIVLPSNTSIGDVSATEIGYLDGATSAIQVQLNTKATTGKAIAMAIVFGG